MKESTEEYIGWFGGEKGKGKCNFTIISKGRKKPVSTVLLQAGRQRVNANIFKFTF